MSIVSILLPTQVIIKVSEPLRELDGCLPCPAVWFDAPSYETMPEGGAETPNTRRTLAPEIFAERRLKKLKTREAQEETERKKARKKKGIRDL